MTSHNPLWDLIQRYMDSPAHRYPPKSADLARETGVSNQVISKWKKMPVLPDADQLSAFSAGTGIPYITLLSAALLGKGYLSDPHHPGARPAGPADATLAWIARTGTPRERAVAEDVLAYWRARKVLGEVGTDAAEAAIDGLREQIERRWPNVRVAHEVTEERDGGDGTPGPFDDDLDALPDEREDPQPIRGRSRDRAARREDD